MRYFDVHTHQPAIHEEDVAIVNTIVGREEDVALEHQTVDYRSCGIHPWYIYNNVEEHLARLETLANDSSCVAIGEAGLDKYATVAMDVQKRIFMEQALLSERIRKPLIIHCVKAWEDLTDCRKRIRPRMPWIIHGFRGKKELAAQLVRQGFYLSFGVRFNPQALWEAWPDHLLVETDDQLVDIRLVYSEIARALNLTLDNFCTQIHKNISILGIG